MKLNCAFVSAIAATVAVLGLISIIVTFRNGSGKLKEQSLDEVEWWKKTSYYHIYIRSFADSDGDGNGDLRGLIQKLDYLLSINVGTILMSPFYSSPLKDGGYDVDDYLKVNPKYGTMQDIEDLFREAKMRGMKVVVDFVPNHSSNLHRWFKCSERALIDDACAQYKDYYVWSNSSRYTFPDSDIVGPRPNNWRNEFDGGSAWTWSETRKEFYYHNFLAEQPDLNYRHKPVIDEMRSIARFWLRKGADGLRVDAVLYLFEDKLLRDNPPNPNYDAAKAIGNPAERYYSIKTLYTKSLNETVTMFGQFRDVAKEPEFANMDKVVIVEAYDEIDILMRAYGTPERRLSDMPFNFELITRIDNNNIFLPHHVRNTITSWLGPLSELRWPQECGALAPWTIWVLGNHDRPRLVSRAGNANASMLMQMLAATIFGVPVSYYGDEIGLENSNQDKIPQATIDEGEPSRLIFRGPMPWTAAKPSGGFSSSANPWLPLEDNYAEHNVETQLEQINAGKTNALGNYLKLQKLRQKYLATIIFGDSVFYTNEPSNSSAVFAMSREHKTLPNLLVVANFNFKSSERVKLTLPLDETHSVFASDESMLEVEEHFKPNGRQVPKRGKVLMLNYVAANSGDDNFMLSPHNTVDIDGLVLGPSQGAIIEYERDE